MPILNNLKTLSLIKKPEQALRFFIERLLQLNSLIISNFAMSKLNIDKK
jgi:hypothetical protein